MYSSYLPFQVCCVFKQYYGPTVSPSVEHGECHSNDVLLNTTNINPMVSLERSICNDRLLTIKYMPWMFYLKLKSWGNQGIEIGSDKLASISSSYNEGGFNVLTFLFLLRLSSSLYLLHYIHLCPPLPSCLIIPKTLSNTTNPHVGTYFSQLEHQFLTWMCQFLEVWMTPTCNFLS